MFRGDSLSGEIAKEDLIRLAYGEPPSPNRGRLIRALEMQSIKPFSAIGAQEIAKSSKASGAGALWARFRKSSREFHHGKVKACRDAKGAE